MLSQAAQIIVLFSIYFGIARSIDACLFINTPQEILGELDREPRPWKSQAQNLPTGWDWRNVSGVARGVSFLGPIRNQMTPKYCGSCWAMASTSAVADRFVIWTFKELGRFAAGLTLSVQNVVACALAKGCNGGGFYDTYKLIKDKGVPQESCNNYQAISQNCTLFNQCGNCPNDGPCQSVQNYTSYRVSKFGDVTGRQEMMIEILNGGPITCGIMATDELVDFTGGRVFTQRVEPLKFNHMVSVVGWGVDPEVGEYWIVRNSWGSWWGEEGWFRLPTSQAFPNDPDKNGNDYNLNIEGHQCSYADPIVM